MTMTILPLLMALVALLALDGLTLLFGAETTSSIDDATDWI
jgi:hypothetical protein